MSWIDKLSNVYKITTGDGEVYAVLWKIAQQNIEFNVAEFNFPNVRGTLVKKSEAMGRKFPFEFYIQGADHLDVSERFRLSMNDKRPCKLDHPYYGIVYCQIPSLSFDNTEHNVTKITGTAIETILDDNPKVTIDNTSMIKVLQEQNSEELALVLTEKPTTSDVTTMGNTNNKVFKSGVPIIELPEEFENYFNLFNTASTYINTATATPLLAMRATISVLTAPSKFTASVKSRIDLLSAQMDTLRSTIINLTTVSSKQIYQAHSGALMQALCLGAITPLPGDYKNNTDVFKVIDTIVSRYNQNISDLDSLQGLNGGDPDSFIPNGTAMYGLNTIFNNTISNLFQIALGSRSERSVILMDDTNIILLTHKYYGLDKEDKNIEEMMANNNIGLNELYQIKKGRKIVYYV